MPRARSACRRSFGGRISQRLGEVLALTGGRVTPDSQVAEALAEMAPHWPAQSVSCIATMARACEEGWELHGWRDPLRAILQAAIASGDQTARNTAVRLIHELGERSVVDLQDLLP